MHEIFCTDACFRQLYVCTLHGSLSCSMCLLCVLLRFVSQLCLCVCGMFFSQHLHFLVFYASLLFYFVRFFLQLLPHSELILSLSSNYECPRLRIAMVNCFSNRNPLTRKGVAAGASNFRHLMRLLFWKKMNHVTALLYCPYKLNAVSEHRFRKS